MIRPVDKKPQIDPFGDMPSPSRDFIFHELYDENGIYGFAAMDFRFRPFCYLHLEINRWNHRVFKEMKKDWIFAKNIIRSLDCDTVVLTKAGTLAKQKSYKKLIESFGFPEPIECTISSREV